MKFRPSSARAGFSLVLSLIILTLLAILVVGFLSSTAIDRATAHAFGDKARAEAAAGTAVNQAMSMLREYITQYPDSVTTWEKLTPAAGGPAVEGTMLYYHDLPPPSGLDAVPTTPKRYMLPLMSIGTDANGAPRGPVEVKDKSKVLGTSPGDAWHEAFWMEGKLQRDPDCIDLNRPQFNDDKVGWIGAAPDGRKPYYAKWIEAKEKTNVDGKTDEGKIPKTIGRYAFWVEDESFKVNLNLLDKLNRGTEVTENARIKTDDPSKYPLPPQIAALLPVQGLLRSARTATVASRDAVAVAATDLRDSFYGKRLPEIRSFNQLSVPFVDGTGKTALFGDESKFLATTVSGGLNLSRHGSQRLNLNGLGLETAPSQVTMTKQVRQLVEAIRYHAPKFGQRFYRLQYKVKDPTTLSDAKTGQELVRRNAEQVPAVYPSSAIRVLTSHQDTYLYKLAANIRDYIDPDPQPTLVVLDPSTPKTRPMGMVVAPRDTTQFDLFAREGPNPCWAQGKESAPFIQEVVARFRSEATGGNGYRLQIDYYIEVWNMTDRALSVDAGDLGADPFFKISNPVRWFGRKSTGGYGDPLLGMPLPTEPRDLILKLKGLGVVFQPGACTVITSAPPDPKNPTEFAMIAPYTGAGGGTAGTTGGFRSGSLYRIPTTPEGQYQIGAREFSGSIPQPATGTKNNGFWPMPRDPSASGTPNQEDYETEVVFGNESGLLDTVAFAVSMGGGGNVTYINATNGKIARDDTYGGTLRGNANPSSPAGPTPSQLGDPRTNNEQLAFLRYKGGGDPDQTRYFNATVGDAKRFSLGWPNSRFVAPYLNSNLYVPGGAPYGYPWPDYYKAWLWSGKDAANDALNPNVDTAPAFVRNANLTSIGQLGDVFDPARVLNITPTATMGIEYSRGGGRTLKIGQPDDLVDMLSSADKATSRAWAAWRLADFLSTSGEISLPGQININGLRRDNGAAFRAACYGMKIKPVWCSASLAAPPAGPYEKDLLSDEGAATGVQVFINQAIRRMRDNDPAGDDPEHDAYNASAAYFGPFMERGEISELPLFSAPTSDLVAGINMSETFDRGREELFRRLAEMITTRGNVFSVYAIGQSVTQEDASTTASGLQAKKRITATHQVKVTFALVPKKSDGSDFKVVAESFDPTIVDPTNASSIAARFAKPDHYDVQILQVSSL